MFGSEIMVYYSMLWQVYDLIHLADYLTKRDDIDPSRIGITGIGLGGWLRDIERNMLDGMFNVIHRMYNSFTQEYMHGLLHLLILVMLWLFL